MAKVYLLVIVVLAYASFTPQHALAQAFTNESTSFSAGYGFVTLSKVNWFDLYNVENRDQFGPIYLKAERGISDHIGIGLNFAYVQNEWRYSYEDFNSLGNPVIYTETDTRTSYSILARINFHIGSSKKVDPYAGFSLGYRNVDWKFTTNDPNGNYVFDLEELLPYIPLGFEFAIGVRYLLSPNFGLYTEWGGAKSIFQFGALFNIPGEPRTVVPLIHP